MKQKMHRAGRLWTQSLIGPELLLNRLQIADRLRDVPWKKGDAHTRRIKKAPHARGQLHLLIPALHRLTRHKETTGQGKRSVHDSLLSLVKISPSISGQPAFWRLR